jgi:hypothetical protein
MTADNIKRLSDAILHEGYMLFPYRPSAVKNRKRWTFGAICPRPYSDANEGTEAWQVKTECLVRVEGVPTIEVQMRFLHVMESRTNNGSWQQGTARDVVVPPLALHEEAAPHVCFFEFAGSGADGDSNAAQSSAVRYCLEGWIEIATKALRPDLLRVSVTVSNTKALDDAEKMTRDEAMMHSFVSTHLILGVDGGSFVSLLEPPPDCIEAASQCRNAGLFPVLVGERGDQRTILASPVILYDYPQIAPESTGDLFDATEIDEFLILQIMALSDAEKEEMRASDPQARRILERIESTADPLRELHGAVRKVESASPPSNESAATRETPPLIESVSVKGVPVRRGDRIRLHPRRSADIMDLALAGKIAIVEAIEQDFENRIHVAVAVEDDPGRELGTRKRPGHQFFFSPEEIELVDEVRP